MNAVGREAERRFKVRKREVNREARKMSTPEIIRAAEGYLQRIEPKYHEIIHKLPLIEIAKLELGHRQLYGY